MFWEHTFMYVYRYVYIYNVVTSPKVQQRMKARAGSKFCEKLNFHRFYVSCEFTAFTGGCSIYIGFILGGSTPQTFSCFLSLYSLKFCPSPPYVINGYRCLDCHICFLQIFIKHSDSLRHSSLVKSLELWEPSNSRNDGGGWHKAADPGSCQTDSDDVLWRPEEMSWSRG